MFWFFGREACGILAPQPGIEPAPPVLEGEVLTTGPPGKSLVLDFHSHMYSFCMWCPCDSGEADPSPNSRDSMGPSFLSYLI